MSHWDYGTPYPAPFDEPDSGEEDEEIYNPISYERDAYPPDIDDWGNAGPGAYADAAPSLEPMGAPGPRHSAWPDESWPPRLPRRPSRPRWLIPVAIALVAAVVGATFVLTGGGGHAAARPSPARQGTPSAPATRAAAPAAPAPPLTMARAQQVMDNYTANNAANTRMSDAPLGSIETGSSYSIDLGAYREQRARKSAAYPPFGPKQAELFIPRQVPGTYPRWFVALVANADLASPGRIVNTEYLLFTQATPGALWKNAIEPYVLKGGGTPVIATDSGGFAVAVPGSGATGLSIAPGQIAAVTAKSLDGGGPVPNPGNLDDLSDLAFWHSRLPASATATDRHAPGSGGVFGLRTLDGGALLFFTGTAEIRLAPPWGAIMHLTIPGFYSPGENLRSAGIGYLEQFAVYDPPHGGAGLRVVADYSGITARN